MNEKEHLVDIKHLRTVWNDTFENGTASSGFFLTFTIEMVGKMLREIERLTNTRVEMTETAALRLVVQEKSLEAAKQKQRADDLETEVVVLRARLKNK